MMKLRNGAVYMAPLDAPVLGCVSRRMWWKPWRWQVVPLHWTKNAMKKLQAGTYVGCEPGVPITDLSKEGAVAMMKLYGVEHKDFEGEGHE